MANIKNLQMWNSICSDTRINVNKSFFGLCQKVVYQSTNSALNAKVLEFSTDDGEVVKRILGTPIEKLASVAGSQHPKPTINGGYLAEVCISADKNFVAVQLFQFSQLNYVAITEVCTFEGSSASLIANIFT